MLLGSGELGKEVAVEPQRLGVEVIAVDRYPNAPATQVAHSSHVIDMLDESASRALINQERPDLIVPEIEAIATSVLVELEAQGQRVIPTAMAARLTMDREGIRNLAAQTLGVPTSPFRFAATYEEYQQAITAIGLPCVVKPVMSSSGKGQSTLHTQDDVDAAWHYTKRAPRRRRKGDRRGIRDFDYEITPLTVRHVGGTSFCEPMAIDRRVVTIKNHGSLSP